MRHLLEKPHPTTSGVLQTLTRLAKNIGIFAREALFPTRCLCCEEYGRFLCRKCRNHIRFRTEFVCPSCREKGSRNGIICPSCVGKCPIDGIFSATTYGDKTIERLIHSFKYGFIEAIGPILADILAQKLASSDIPLPDIILPVPLHKRRLRWRGFNHASIISRSLAENLLPSSRLTCDDEMLLRRRYTKPQAQISGRKKRLANIAGAFTVSDGGKLRIKGKRVWVVDDVSTTGGTLIECASALRKAGAREIWGIVVAT